MNKRFVCLLEIYCVDKDRLIKFGIETHGVLIFKNK